MKTTFLLGSLAFAGLLTTAHAQTAPTTTPLTPASVKQRTADRRAATYTGPKVVKDTKKLGQEFIHDSKPAPKTVSPAKQ